MTTTGSRDGQSFQAIHLFLAHLFTTPNGLMQLVRDCWSAEGWHWIRDTQLHEVAHRYRGNGAGAMAMLPTAAMNLLRMAGYRSIRTGMQVVMHDITALLAIARRQPFPDAWRNFELALPADEARLKFFSVDSVAVLVCADHRCRCADHCAPKLPSHWLKSVDRDFWPIRLKLTIVIFDDT